MTAKPVTRDAPTPTLNGMPAELTIALPSGEVWTWDDLQAVPDDRYHYYQLIEGQIVMSPSPNFRHQKCVLGLAIALTQAAPRDLDVLVAPFDFVPEETTSLQPDVLVFPRGAAEKNRLVVPPVLAVEVLSRRTRTFDLTAKRAVYARSGVLHHWIADPDEPSIVALELGAGGDYVEVASGVGDAAFRATAPFAVEIVPAQLVAD